VPPSNAVEEDHEEMTVSERSSDQKLEFKKEDIDGKSQIARHGMQRLLSEYSLSSDEDEYDQTAVNWFS
jgi:hypothetical protein